MSVTRNSDGESVSTFTALNPVNSFVLSATYVLRMREPLILCRLLAQRIQVFFSVSPIVGVID